MIAAGDAP